MLKKTLINAIQDKNLIDTLEGLKTAITQLPLEDQHLLTSADSAIQALIGDVTKELNRLISTLEIAKIDPVFIGRAMPNVPVHNIRIEIKTSDLESVVELLESLGYSSESRDKRSTWACYSKFYNNTQFHDTSSTGFVINLVWQPAFTFSGRWKTFFMPNRDDLKAINIPAVAWPAYCLVHVLRRFNRNTKTRSNQSLGPFLGTPSGIIKVLLEFANLKQGHTLVDLGCGDGRVLVSAATIFDCQCIGYEMDLPLVEQAKRNVEQAELSHRVTITMADANTADISNADVVFLFLPVASIKLLLPLLLQKMKTGSVLIAHEQDRLETDICPDERYPVITRQGVTVAHKWIVKRDNPIS